MWVTSGYGPLGSQPVNLCPQTVLVAGNPHLGAHSPLLVAAAFPNRPVRPLGPLGVEVYEPTAAVDALAEPQHLDAIAEYAVVLPVRAGGNGTPVEVGREHGAESY